MFAKGDLVKGAPQSQFEGFYGVVFGHDEDDDPLVWWHGCIGSWERARTGEFKSQVQHAQ